MSVQKISEIAVPIGNTDGARHAGAAKQLGDAGADQRLGDIAREQTGDGDAQLRARQHERRAPGHASARAAAGSPASAWAVRRDRFTAV